MENKTEEEYWTNRYRENNTGWDIGYPSTPIASYIDQLIDKEISILIPGAGNGYEAEYLVKNRFTNVTVIDISRLPLDNLRKRIGNDQDINLLHEDFFQHTGVYDLIIEQTFFCSFLPSVEMRSSYAEKMSELLHSNGKLVGLWFNIPLEETKKRPYGGNEELYRFYLEPFFKFKIFEEAYNSIKPRSGKEFFGILEKID
jgi:thiopurine S-methyltransferase